MTMYALLAIILFVMFYWFVVLPKAVERHVYYRKGKPFEISYHADLQNLRDCITRANSVDKLDICKHAVDQFKTRNKFLKRAGFKVNLKNDTAQLYTMISNKYKTINN